MTTPPNPSNLLNHNDSKPISLDDEALCNQNGTNICVDNQEVEIPLYIIISGSIIGVLVLMGLAIAGYYCYNKHRRRGVGLHRGEEVS